MKRVLITPLDWGLGHATRCIPVIRELQLQGCEVLVAGSGDSLRLLQKEFPLMKTFVLPGYEPRYPGHGFMVLAMALQLPHFMRVIQAEHKAVDQIIEQENADALISDNRYGCWSRKIPSVFITHQSNILMPKRFGWLQHIVRKINDRMINRFDSCWIPDTPGDPSLAGDLMSFGKATTKINIAYIGWLSRFTPKNNAEKKYDVIAVFSGPEPQRTLVENIVLPQLRNSALRYLVIRGLPGLENPRTDDRVIDFLSSGMLNEALDAAELVIARSGFSTVMDMQALGKKVVFIPTPGQTEQEYLASRLMKKGIAYFMRQDQFRLDTALAASKNFTGFTRHENNALLRHAISGLLASRE